MPSEALKITRPPFRLLGFEIRIEASWILRALIIMWTIAAGLFPYTYSGMSESTYWWKAMAETAGMLVSIAFHEPPQTVVCAPLRYCQQGHHPPHFLGGRNRDGGCAVQPKAGC